jgi:hypothetical protein
MTNMQENCSKKIHVLFEKYNDNEFILNKLNNYIINVLPLQLENDQNNYNKKVERHDKLLENSKEFIDKYLNNNNYFYCVCSEIYFKYDSLNYLTYKLDTILYEIYSLINRDENLLPWKQRIKTNLIKEIKDRSIFESIPNSDTIQFVINNLLFLFFNNKNLVKYFLTVIGDIILKKNENHIYIINSGYKNFIKLLSNLAYEYFGTNSFNNFKYQYHELHTMCRIIYIDKNVNNNKLQNITDLLINNFNNKYHNNLLDIFLVGVYYSNRFENSDNFLQECEIDIHDNVFLLDNNDKFITKFINSMIEKCSNDETYNISGKNMHYLWKLFLKENDLPNIYLLNIFKTILKKNVSYNNDKDMYIGVTSKKLPTISLFIEFWNKTIISDASVNVNTDSILEINEIIVLFRFWLNKNNHNNILNLNESMIIDIINHFFENVAIEEDKYITNISNILWDKNKDIIAFLDHIKSEYLKQNKNVNIQINNFFTVYCKFCKDNNYKFIVDKTYFEKFICEYLQTYILDKIIDKKWIHSI